MVAAATDSSAAVAAALDSATVLSVVRLFEAKENVAWVFVLCCCGQPQCRKQYSIPMLFLDLLKSILGRIDLLLDDVILCNYP